MKLQGACALVLAMASVAACSRLAGTNAGGYIAGEGQVRIWAPQDRGAPVSYTGRLLDGAALSLIDHRGVPVVVNIWWSGCGECVHEMPLLEEAKHELGAGAFFVGIDTRDGSAETGQAFERSNGAAYPSFYSPDGRALLAFGALPAGTPATVVLDREGRVVATVRGAITSRTLVADLVACVADIPAARCELG